MVAHGIGVEKSGLLAQQAQAARGHKVRISEQQGKIIAALIRAFMESCGLPVGTPGVGAVIRALLEQCWDGEPSGGARAARGRAGARGARLPGDDDGAVWVRDRLAEAGWEVEVADARKVKSVAPLACKTDKVDARVLAELCRRELVPALRSRRWRSERCASG
jgi:transposase